MRIIGMDIHRTFAEVMFLEDGELIHGGPVQLCHDEFSAFARSLHSDDEVVLEATGNAMAVAEVLRAPCWSCRDRQPAGGSRDRPCQDQDRQDRRGHPGPTPCQRVPAGGLDPGRAHPGVAPAGGASQLDRAPTHAPEEHRALDPAHPSHRPPAGGASSFSNFARSAGQRLVIASSAVVSSTAMSIPSRRRTRP